MVQPNRFYEEELNYLVEAGREYARLHPERARFLNLSDPRARDPHVERLIEAFAFLSGSVRMKLEDDFPELTRALLDLVWPHALRPIPSMALLEMKPVPGLLREPRTVPRGFLVDSVPTSAGIACRFRTAFSVDVLPLELLGAEFVVDDSGTKALALRLAFQDGVDGAKFPIPRLRLAILGEPPQAFAIHRLLRHRVRSARIVVSRDDRRLLPEGCVRPVGFADDDAVLAWSPVSFTGYRLLSEYFAFPEKFLFVDVVGIGEVRLPKGENAFTLEFRFDERPPDTLRPTLENFRLFATPVVNLFRQPGEPILVRHLRAKSLVVADAVHPDAVEVVDVEQVESLRSSDGRRSVLAPFFSFTHSAGNADAVYHSVTHRIGGDGGWRTDIALVTKTPGELPAEETLSLELTCTNGRLAEEIGLGDLRIPASEQIDSVRFANVTRPTAPIYPDLGGGLEWRFISHMALNLLSISEVSAFRSLLALYDAGGRGANAQRIDAIREISASARERLVRGAPVRGTELAMTIDETKFAGPGDLRIFLDVLAEFLALYTPINSFTELVATASPSGEVLRRPPVTGRQALV